ncbi:MAG: GTP 3',8-cyclase MoaA, partial [Candidatus Hydrogenedentales bacterium]
MQEEAGTIDAFGRAIHDLRISVTDKCNLRCPYCMPEEFYHEEYEFLPKSALLTFEELARLARLFARLGVSKLRITGGEPLIRKNLPDLIAMLATIDEIADIALTTNGILLAARAKALKEAGLHRLTVSLDSLDEATFARMTGGRGSVHGVLEGIAASEEAGFAPIKINVVVQRGVNDATVMDLVKRFRGTGHILRFIEYMDVGNMNGWHPGDVVPSSEILARIHAEFPLEPISRGYRGEVASRYRWCDGAGEIGFVSSVTEPFCRDCTRARLSADGKVYTCLFATHGTDLRGPLRAGVDDDGLLCVLESMWRVRKDRYSELRTTIRAEHS